MRDPSSTALLVATNMNPMETEMSKRVCPDCENDRFFVTAIEHHQWTVDGDGNFDTDWGCHEAEIVDDVWECTDCHAIFDGPACLVDPNARRDDDVDPPDDYDERDAFERLTDLEIRYNR
mgnify:FL=1